VQYDSSFCNCDVNFACVLVLYVSLLQTDWAKAAADTADSNGLVVLDALAATALRSIR
jgi:hypothetical protein